MAVEIPTRRFGERVARAGDTHAGNPGPDEDRRRAGIVEEERDLELVSLDRTRAGRLGRVVVAEELDAIGFPGKLHGEMDVSSFRPAEYLSTAGQRAIRIHSQRRALDADRLLRRLLLAVREVDQDVRRALGEVVAMEPGARRYRQFGKDAGLEPHAIIAGFGMLVRITLAIAGVGIFRRAGDELERPGCRHDQHIEHVADAGSGEMGVRKAHDRPIGLVIARAAVPSGIVGVGRELDHAGRQRCAGIGMAMSAGPNEQARTSCGGCRSLGQGGGGEGAAQGGRGRPCQQFATIHTDQAVISSCSWACGRQLGAARSAGRRRSRSRINSPKSPFAQANQGRE